MTNRSRGRDAVAVTLLFLLASVVRWLPLGRLLEQSREFPIGFIDTVYHLRRMELMAAGGHWAPPFDRYVTYPTGGDFTWPVLFDWLLGVASLVAGLGSFDRVSGNWAAAVVPALVGAFAVLPAYGIGKLLAGRFAGIAAGAMIAVFPLHVMYSAFGRPDHHCAATLLMALFLWGLLKCERAAVACVLSFRALVTDVVAIPIRPLVWTGIAGAAVVSVQTGAILLVSVFSGYLLVRVLACAWGPGSDDAACAREAREARDATESLLAAAFVVQSIAFVALFVMTVAFGGPRRFDIVYNQPSLFQPIVFGMFAVFPLFLHFLSDWLRGIAAPAIVARATVVLSAVAVFLVVPLASVPPLFEAVQAAAGWVGKEEVYVPKLLESRPLFMADGTWSLEAAWRHAGLVLPLAVAALIGSAGRVGFGRVAREVRRSEGLVLLWAGSFLALASLQLRFLNFAAPPLAVVAGLGLARLARPVREGSREGSGEGSGEGAASSSGAAAARRFAAAIVLGGVLVTSGLLSARSLDERYLLTDRYVRDACTWLRTSTPATSSFLDPSTPAEYGVMSGPTWGHHVVHLGQRPSTSNPFFDLGGLGRSADFYLARDEAAAVRAMEASNCRYAFFTYRAFDMWYYHSLLAPERQADWARADDELSRIRLLAEGPCLALYYCDGNERFEAALPDGVVRTDARWDRFRLVFESAARIPADWKGVPFTGGTPAASKIFERVEGAELRGRARAGSEVTLEVAVALPSGRAFTFRRDVVADANGFRLRCPYAADESAATVTIRPRGAGSRPKKIPVEIPEAAVVEGGVIEVEGR